MQQKSFKKLGMPVGDTFCFCHTLRMLVKFCFQTWYDELDNKLWCSFEKMKSNLNSCPFYFFKQIALTVAVFLCMKRGPELKPWPCMDNQCKYSVITGTFGGLWVQHWTISEPFPASISYVHRYQSIVKLHVWFQKKLKLYLLL